MIPSATQSNPFFQPPRQWQIRIFVSRQALPAIEEAFGDLALAFSSFEIDEDTSEWGVDIVTDIAPEEADINARLALVSGLLDIPTPVHDVKTLEPKDWASEVQQSFPPLHVGRFYVYGSHITSPPPQGKIALRISAGAAFGSGEHATTSGCLQAFGLLSGRRFTKPLDMGCGSGILAIAIAKLWHVDTLGIDIDPVSVSVARENAVLNRVHRSTRFEAGDGYHTPAVRMRAPFDLIVANILARPLVCMAPMLARSLEPGGVVVLSGLLDYQERMVLAAHRMQGLKLFRRISIRNWHTLMLRK
jgi:ribosomal protein L11 methyltransferase